MSELSVICWKWAPHYGYRSSFGPETVNTLRRMVAKNYPKPHRFICITDESAGIDPDIEIVPLWDDFRYLHSPHGHPRNPSCYRRLRAFKADIGDVFGPRFVQLDLDCVVTGDLSPLFDRPEDFVIWGDTNPRTLYNSSLLLLKAGTRTKVWDTFDETTSPRKSREAQQFGSDQGWISYCLGPGEARFTKADGVYSFRNEILPSGVLPKNSRLVVFHGQIDPWSLQAQALPWVREHYLQHEPVA